MSRPKLSEIRNELVFLLDDEWKTTEDLRRELDFVVWSKDYVYVALVLERAAHEGWAELKNPASRGKRYFRRRRA
jgi:hypothetical protein